MSARRDLAALRADVDALRKYAFAANRKATDLFNKHACRLDALEDARVNEAAAAGVRASHSDLFAVPHRVTAGPENPVSADGWSHDDGARRLAGPSGAPVDADDRDAGAGPEPVRRSITAADVARILVRVSEVIDEGGDILVLTEPDLLAAVYKLLDHGVSPSDLGCVMASEDDAPGSRSGLGASSGPFRAPGITVADVDRFIAQAVSDARVPYWHETPHNRTVNAALTWLHSLRDQLESGRS